MTGKLCGFRSAKSGSSCLRAPVDGAPLLSFRSIDSFTSGLSRLSYGSTSIRTRRIINNVPLGIHDRIRSSLHTTFLYGSPPGTAFEALSSLDRKDCAWWCRRVPSPRRRGSPIKAPSLRQGSGCPCAARVGRGPASADRPSKSATTDRYR